MFLDNLLLETKDCQGVALQGIHNTQDPLQKKLYLNLLEEANGLINRIEGE